MDGAVPPPAPAQPSGSAAAEDRPPPPAPGGEPAPTLKALLAGANALLEEASGALRGRAELFSLELRHAGAALLQMVALALVAGLLASVAWAGLMVALHLALVSLGLHWSLSLLLVVLLNLGGMLAALTRARLLGARLGFPATRRRLRFGLQRSEREALGSPAERQEAANGHP